jgi:hypothetical protein
VQESSGGRISYLKNQYVIMLMNTHNNLTCNKNYFLSHGILLKQSSKFNCFPLNKKLDMMTNDLLAPLIFSAFIKNSPKKKPLKSNSIND